jgi:PAS domain S-box-containing protein
MEQKLPGNYLGEKFSNSLLERLHIAVILIDRDFKIIFFNQKANDITGINLGSFLGESFFKALKLKNEKGENFDLQKRLISIFKGKTGSVNDLTGRYFHPFNKELWFSVSMIPMVESGDEINHIAICLQDISHNSEIETDLRESEIRYETVFNSVNDGIFLYEPNEFSLIDVNDRIVKMYGYSRDELKNKQIGDLSVKEEGFTNRRGFLYALRAIYGETQVHEWHARNKKGHTFWTRLLLKKVNIGETPFLMGIIKDIDDQKKAELSLRDSEEHYRVLAQNSPDVIMRFDRSFRHLFVNDTVKKIVPVDPNGFLNKTHKEMGIFPPEMCEFWEYHINEVFITGKSSEVEFYIDSPAGRIFMEWRLFPEYNNKGQIFTVLAVARDITEKKLSQDNLRKSEEQLQYALEATSDGIWDWDISRNQIYYSPRFFTMLGYKRDELEHTVETLYMLIHPDDREKITEAYNQQTLIKQDSLKVEVRMRRKDGTYAWILFRGKVFAKNEKGYPVRLVGTNVDISQRKWQDDIRNVIINISEAVNTTRNLEEFFESIQFFLGKVVDTKNCYIAFYDKETDIITLPFHRDERDKFKEFPAGKTITAYVVRTGQTQLLDAEKIKKLAASGEIEIIGTPSVSWLGIPLRIENELIGIFVVQSYDKSVIYNEEDAKILEFVSDQIALAIARKKDQDRIFEDQVRQRQIFESLPDGLLVTSKEGIIIDHNSRAIQLLNCQDKEIIQMNISQFISSSDKGRVMEFFKEAIDSGFRKQMEILMVRDDRSEFFAEISIGLIQKAIYKPKTFVITIKDIEERKAYEINLKLAKEKAEESDQLKTAFLSNMSHEIRTPMNAIIGFAELLSHGAITDDEKKEFISQINYGAESLMRLIDDIIDIAKIEAGQIKIYNSFFDLSAILKDLKSMFSRNLQRFNKQHLQLFEDNNGFNTSVQLYGDQIRIRQILSNLISNAIKFTENGEIRFGIRNIKEGQISFYVKDTGIGIPEEKFEIIFDRFRQGHESKAKFYGGTGLGLAISKHLVELMGGSISFISQNGVGSEFIFTIPYISIDGQISELENIFEKINLNWNNKTLLIVEDEASSFILLNEVLKPTNIRIIWAKDGNEAVELFNKNPDIDLVLMDIQLPKLSGYEVTRIIKGKKPEIPVIAQTAYAMSGEKLESIKAGCDDYMSKPIKIQDLFMVMSKYLRG